MAYINSGFKKFASIHEKLALQLSKCLQEANKWMMKEKITLIQKDPPPKKETIPSSYRLIGNKNWKSEELRPSRL